jgi:hypothetical protein
VRPGDVIGGEGDNLDLLVAQQPPFGVKVIECGVAQCGTGQVAGTSLGGGFVVVSSEFVRGAGGIGVAGQPGSGTGVGFQCSHQAEEVGAEVLHFQHAHLRPMSGDLRWRASPDAPTAP